MTEAIDNGIIELTKCERLGFFCAWTQWNPIYFPSIELPNLQSICCKKQLNVLAAFAYHVRHNGYLQQQQQVCTQTFLVELWSISTKVETSTQ